MLVEGAGRPFVPDPPDLIQERKALDDLTVMVEKKAQQPKLPGRDGERLFALSAGVSFGVDGHVPECDRSGVSGRRLHPGAAEAGADPGQQLAHAERLDDIIIRAHLQPDHLVDFLPFGREHQDRSQAVCLADLPADIVAALFRDHDVEEDKRRLFPGINPERLGPVFGRRDRISLRLQQIPEAGQDGPVILDDQDQLFSHGCPWFSWRGRRIRKTLPPPSLG